MNSFLKWLFMRKKENFTIEWRIGPVGVSNYTVGSSTQKSETRKKQEESSMSLILTAVQSCPLSVVFKDSRGNVAPVEACSWSTSDSAILVVRSDKSAAPQEAVVHAVAVGTAQVNVRADAHHGEGVNEIIGVLDVEIVAAEATVVEISAGTPVDSGAAPAKAKK